MDHRSLWLMDDQSIICHTTASQQQQKQKQRVNLLWQSRASWMDALILLVDSIHRFSILQILSVKCNLTQKCKTDTKILILNHPCKQIYILIPVETHAYLIR